MLAVQSSQARQWCISKGSPRPSPCPPSTCMGRGISACPAMPPLKCRYRGARRWTTAGWRPLRRGWAR